MVCSAPSKITRSAKCSTPRPDRTAHRSLRATAEHSVNGSGTSTAGTSEDRPRPRAVATRGDAQDPRRARLLRPQPRRRSLLLRQHLRAVAAAGAAHTRAVVTRHQARDAGPARVPRDRRGAAARPGHSARRRIGAVSYTHLRAHETPEHLVCRLLLEK